MPVHRADVLVVDPYPVFEWIKELFAFFVMAVRPSW